MKKPKPKIVAPRLDWYECAAYISKKLGYSIEDCAGKWTKNAPKWPDNDKIPYQDFWHFMCDYNNVHNGSFITVPEDSVSATDGIGYVYEDWQKKIIDAFNEEFGVGTEYWVEW